MNRRTWRCTVYIYRKDWSSLSASYVIIHLLHRQIKNCCLYLHHNLNNRLWEGSKLKNARYKKYLPRRDKEHIYLFKRNKHKGLQPPPMRDSMYIWVLHFIILPLFNHSKNILIRAVDLIAVHPTCNK